MGGHQVTNQNPNDSGYDEDGFDESQRAEILEATRDGPSDGTLLTDIAPDLGGEPLEDDDDELAMASDEIGEEDEDADSDEDDMDEDAAQSDFENDDEEDDDTLSDGDAVALQP